VTAFRRERYGSLVEKASALFHSLIANHPFVDGNKRTAVVALDLFLLANEYYLTIPDNKMYPLAMSVATYRERGIGHAEILHEIARVLEASTVPFGELRNRRNVAAVYEHAVAARKEIRRNPLNRKCAE
jgi:prophage maintenance system killer protein